MHIPRDRFTRSLRPIAFALLLATIAACGRAPAPAASPAGALPIELFRYDHSAPLHVQTSPLGTEEGVEVFEISYASPAGGRVSGRLYVPQGPPPFAGIVYAHGTGAGARTQGPRAVYLARHGAVVLTPDAPYIRRGGEIPTFTPLDSAEQVQHVRDLQRAFDVLITRSDVDDARLAYIGRSHGGAMGALLAGVERRVKTYILIVADGGLVTHFRNPAEPSGAFPALADDVRQRWLAAMTPIEPIRYIQRAPPASILFQNGRQDESVSPSDAAALHAAARGTTEVQWYNAGHRLDTESFVDQLKWLHQHAGMRAPGPDAAAGPNFPPPAPARQ